jgi:restriction system protein
LVYLNPYPEEAAWLKPDPPMLPSLEERLRAIDWYQFEKVVGAIYEVYGCNVKRLGGAKPDGGIDLIAEKNGERTVVQCKQWRNRAVKVREVRELLGTLKDANIESGVLVALSGCTDDARALADKHKIAIVDEAELVKLIREADGSIDHRIKKFLEDDTKYCPRCEHPLVLRTAAKGPNPGEQFWGCSEYPRCHYTRPNS